MEKTPTKFHALQLFTDTFIAETVHLTNEQIGIYIRLLCFDWTKNCKGFEEEDAYRICQCIDQSCKDKVYKILKKFFLNTLKEDPQDGRMYTIYFHKRLVEEHKYLTEKYNKQSKAGKLGMKIRYNGVNNKTVTPIPIPNPIPNKNIYDQPFEELWNLLNIKKGAKYKAFKVWQKCNTEMPEIEKTAEIYNNQQKGKDAQFVPHFATWLFQKRWEIQEQDENFDGKTEPTLVDRMKKLGYLHRGSEGQYEQFVKNKINYKINRFQKDAEIELDQL